MQLKTKEFQEVAGAILLAVDDNAANLELVTKNNFLYLNVTNREYYTAIKFAVEIIEDFRAVVDAITFLNLIAGLTTDTFELLIKNNTLIIKTTKSIYKLPMIYENDKLLELPIIQIQNKTVEMTISDTILKSILNVNSKELLKVKNIDVNELQKLYYIDETGAFTFTSGACLNSFTLEKPIKLLLTDRIVKLFKLFNSDVHFSYGIDAVNETFTQTKVVFETENIYVAAILNCDDNLITRVQQPCLATKNYINEKYTNHLVVSASVLVAAINRLMTFTKNTLTNINARLIPAIITISNNELTITDRQENCETVPIEAGSYVEVGYSLILNLVDLKLVLDSCKNEHITINCGNHRSVVITRGQISNLLPESK